MRSLMSIAMAVLGLGLTGSAAQAQTQALSCHAQVRTACGELKPGNGALHACVTAHLSEFTPDCQEKINARIAKFQARKTQVQSACSADLAKSCADIVPGEGRELMCLKAHQPTLSATCAQTLSAEPRQHFGGRFAGHDHFRACKAEKESYCASVKPGEGRVVSCLQAHQAQLSPTCSEALTRMAQRGAVPGDEVPPPVTPQIK